MHGIGKQSGKPARVYRWVFPPNAPQGIALKCKATHGTAPQRNARQRMEKQRGKPFGVYQVALT